MSDDRTYNLPTMIRDLEHGLLCLPDPCGLRTTDSCSCAWIAAKLREQDDALNRPVLLSEWQQQQALIADLQSKLDFSRDRVTQLEQKYTTLEREHETLESRLYESDLTLAAKVKQNAELESRLEECSKLAAQWAALMPEDCAFAGEDGTADCASMRGAATQLRLVLEGKATIPVVERQEFKIEGNTITGGGDHGIKY